MGRWKESNVIMQRGSLFQEQGHAKAVIRVIIFIMWFMNTLMSISKISVVLDFITVLRDLIIT